MFHKNTKAENRLALPDIGVITQADNVQENKIFTTRSEYGSQAEIYGAGVDNTHQHMVLGYSYQGLPFQIVVNGKNNEDKDKFNQSRLDFIHDHILPLINKYTVELSETDTPRRELMINLAEKIEELRDLHDAELRFTLSLAITYKNEGRLHCAGFGIGDTGLVLRKKEVTEPLVEARWNNDQADAFGDFYKPVDEYIFDTFDVITHDGDEIFGYTHLAESCVDSKVSQRGNVKKNKLKTTAVPKNSNLVNELKNKNLNPEGCLIGSILIPDEARQNAVKKAIYGECKEALDDVLSELHDSDPKKANGLKVYDAIVRLEKRGAPLDDLTVCMKKTLNFMRQPEDQACADELVNAGKKLLERNHNSKEIYSALWKVLGVALMILGGISLGLGVATMAGALPLSFAPPGWAAIGAGAGFCAAGFMLFAAGAKAYSKGKNIKVTHDAVKAMNTLAK